LFHESSAANHSSSCSLLVTPSFLEHNPVITQSQGVKTGGSLK
jgi:hypothetical protein